MAPARMAPARDADDDARPRRGVRVTVARRCVSVMLLFAAISALAVPALAQPAAPEPVAAQPDVQPRHWWTLWSRPSDADRVIVAMWTLHLDHLDEGWSNDGSVAVIWRGYYAGTFETTHGPRGWSAGFERRWLSGAWGPVGAMVGFRTGIVYGYDRRLGWMADKYPILPFAQPVVYARIGPLAADFTYTWVVASVAAAIRF